MDNKYLLVGYKIVACNMVNPLNDLEGSLDELKKAIRKETNYFKKKTFDGHKIKYCLEKKEFEELKDDDFYKNVDKVINILQDINDFDYCIYLRKLDMMDELGL